MIFIVFPVKAASRLQKTGKTITIVIDPGHGGDNEGTIEGTTIEKEMTLITAQAMYDYLSEFDNIRVYMTRTDDTDLSLTDRTEFAKKKGADFLFCLHYNASEYHDFYGSETYISYKEPYTSYGVQFSLIQLEEMEKIGFTLRGVKTRVKENGDDYYGIIRSATQLSLPAVIIEHGHVDHPNDTPYLTSVEQMQELGRADGEAVAKYFGLSSKSLGISYADYAENELIEMNKDLAKSYSFYDQTAPETCSLVVKNIDYENHCVTYELSAEDSESLLICYDYSLDGGLTFCPLQTWNTYDIYQNTDTFSTEFTVQFEPGTQPTVIGRAWNQYTLFTESEPVSVDEPLLSASEKEEIRKQEEAEQEAKRLEAERLEKEQLEKEQQEQELLQQDQQEKQDLLTINQPAAGNSGIEEIMISNADIQKSQSLIEATKTVLLACIGLTAVFLLVLFLIYRHTDSGNTEKYHVQEKTKSQISEEETNSLFEYDEDINTDYINTDTSPDTKE